MYGRCPIAGHHHQWRHSLRRDYPRQKQLHGYATSFEPERRKLRQRYCRRCALDRAGRGQHGKCHRLIDRYCAIAPTITQSFSPTSVGEDTNSTLTMVLSNTNAYALTQAALSDTLPSNLTLPTTRAASTSCSGSLTTTTTSAKLSAATIPANGSCSVTLTASSGTAGTYTNTIAAGALTTAQNAANTVAVFGSLTVTASSGGGALRWIDLVFLAGMGVGGRRRSRRSSVISGPSKY